MVPVTTNPTGGTVSYEPTLFDQPAAVEARDRAIERADRAADPDWKRAVMHTIESLSRLRRTITTDDVWDTVHKWTSAAPAEPRAIGAVMKDAARAGLIRATDRYVVSQRPECHGRPIRVWEVVA
jgi:hypothetical protein